MGIMEVLNLESASPRLLEVLVLDIHHNVDHLVMNNVGDHLVDLDLEESHQEEDLEVTITVLLRQFQVPILMFLVDLAVLNVTGMVAARCLTMEIMEVLGLEAV